MFEHPWGAHLLDILDFLKVGLYPLVGDHETEKLLRGDLESILN